MAQDTKSTKNAKAAPPASNGRTVLGLSGWVLGLVVIAVVLVLAVAGVAIYKVATKTVAPPPPTAVQGTVTGSALLSTITMNWRAPAQVPAGASVKYVVHFATARLSGKPSGAPFQSPCIQDSKSTTGNSVVLPAPFSQGVFYADVTAKVTGKADATSAPILMYGPFATKKGQIVTPTREAPGAIPAFEWCKAQNLTQ